LNPADLARLCTDAAETLDDLLTREQESPERHL